MDYIEKTKMEDFCAYLCEARNFNIGIWYNGAMYGIRYKFGDRFIDSEFHWDDGAENCGTCKPLKKITDSLKDRIDETMFSIHNWRGNIVLHDVLFTLNQLTEEILPRENI